MPLCPLPCRVIGNESNDSGYLKSHGCSSMEGGEVPTVPGRGQQQQALQRVWRREGSPVCRTPLEGHPALRACADCMTGCGSHEGEGRPCCAPEEATAAAGATAEGGAQGTVHRPKAALWLFNAPGRLHYDYIQQTCHCSRARLYASSLVAEGAVALDCQLHQSSTLEHLCNGCGDLGKRRCLCQCQWLLQ